MNQQDAKRKKELERLVGQIPGRLRPIYAELAKGGPAKKRKELNQRKQELLDEMQPLNDELAEIAIRNAQEGGE